MGLRPKSLPKALSLMHWNHQVPSVTNHSDLLTAGILPNCLLCRVGAVPLFHFPVEIHIQENGFGIGRNGVVEGRSGIWRWCIVGMISA